MSSRPLGAFMRSRDDTSTNPVKMPRFSITPSVGRAVAEICASNDTPYKTPGDFARDAFGRLLEDCNAQDPTASVFYKLARLEMLLDSAAAIKLAKERVHASLSTLQFNLDNPYMDDILGLVKDLGGNIDVPWSLDVE